MASEMEMSKFLDKLTALFDKFALNDSVMDVWLDAFRFCEIHILDKSLQQWIETSQKTPTVYDLKTIALQRSGGSFFKKPESENALYNDPDTCKIIWKDDVYDRYLSMRVARKFLQKDSNGNFYYPLMTCNHEVILES